MYKIYKLYWRNKNISPYLYLPQCITPSLCPNPTQLTPKTLLPPHAVQSCLPLYSPTFLSIKAWSAKIRNLFLNLIASISKDLFEGKSREDRVLGGESKVLPRLLQRGFEGVWCELLLASKIGVEMPLKASDDDGLRSMGSSQGLEKRNDINEVVIRTYGKWGWKGFHTICICCKGLRDNCTLANHRKELEMQYR